MSHRLKGVETYSSVALAGETLDSSNISGVINRIEFLPDAHLAHVTALDRSYIQQELLAIWSSWIHALPCPVINRPTAISMFGPVFHPAIWQNYAAEVGLPTARIVHSADHLDPIPPAPVQSAIVCNRQCYSASVSPDLFAACIDLTACSGFDMLEILFGQGPDGQVFSSVTPMPNMTEADPKLLGQVAQFLRRRTR